MPKVSVVIPAYNEAKYIPRNIASFQAQTNSDFEVIVVTRGDDATIPLCKSAGWQVVIQKSKGVSSARLEGFAQAKGDIVASTDADTAVCPSWIDQIIQSFSKDPQVVMIYGPSFFDSKSTYHAILGFFGVTFQKLSHLFGKDHVFGMNFAVTKAAYIKSGGFDPTKITGEDADLGYRIAPFGKVLFIPQLFVHTSARRLQHYGLISFVGHHVKNFFSLLFFGKASSNFKPIR